LVGGGVPLSELTASDVHEYVHEPSVSAGTRRSRFRQLRAVLRWAECGELLDEIDAPRRPDNLPTPIRRHELGKICEGLKRRYRRLRSQRKTRAGVLLWAIPAFRFSFFSGLRAGEIASLRWRDLDNERGVIRLRDTKSGGDQTVPLISPAEAALSDAQRPRGPECYVWRTPEGPERDRNEAEFARQLSRTFKKAREKTDVPEEKTLHDLRAGFATALADAGMGAHQIRDAMRHSNVSTSMKYVKVSRQRLADEMEGALGSEG